MDNEPRVEQGFGEAEDDDPSASGPLDAERKRLLEARDRQVPWRRWGPYLAERQWGSVREDYSADGSAWDFFPHDHARSRVYRWNEDGLLGISDDEGHLCFALAMWNGADPILKERLFGLAGPEGNHGEDVKEYYYYLDSTPTHSYMKALYKYPQRAFPYADLVGENRRRDKSQPEYELLDTGVFDDNRYFDVVVEYAKVAPEDIVIRLTVTNRGPETARLDLMPTLWFRNTWDWGRHDLRDLSERTSREAFGFPRTEVVPGRPWLWASRPAAAPSRAGLPNHVVIRSRHDTLDDYWLACEGSPELLFTENESNGARLWGVGNARDNEAVKDGIEAAVVHGDADAVNPENVGTKFAARYRLDIAAGQSSSVLLRLSSSAHDAPFDGAGQVFDDRIREADDFYRTLGADGLTEDEQLVQRQAFAGLLWSKQFYHYDLAEWLSGDPTQPAPPPQRLTGRNHEWIHLNSHDIISMPDTWEYPWFAAWDLAFHCIPLALIDPEFAKDQMLLLAREWYQHPNGQLPAYEWAFNDVNPPVQAWAAWRVYKIEQRVTGRGDREFLERMFHKLLLNFTWWVNRKDVEGRNVFQGGFLGLDNIGVFDRSASLPTGGHLEQADGTAWMGMYCLNMLTIAVELARENHAYEDVALKFFEHFLYIASALNNIGGSGIPLWNDDDSFFYDILHMPNGDEVPLKVRSLVGLIPLLAVETLEPSMLDDLPELKFRLEWFLDHRPDLASLVSRWHEPGMGDRRLLTLVRGHRMKCLLKRMLDPAEFLSDYGVRSVSRYHHEHPYVLDLMGSTHQVDYEPAESTSGLFGGNSNWRGPVWFPINFLIIEALQKFHHYYGDDFLVECPTGSGQKLTLWQISQDLSHRLIDLFLRGPDGRRPVFGERKVLQGDPAWRDYVLFFEYFHGDNGSGLGASHQTGWTALVAKMLEQHGRME